MAKRANATAEEAAELDLVEDAIGTEEDNAERFTTVHLALGMLGAVVVLLVGIVAFVTLTGGSDANYSMLPEGYRESVGLTTAYEGNGRSALSSAPRSPFPSAQQEAPIILEVDCPADTVHIATGANVADTLCVRGVLVEDDASTPTPEKSETIRLIVVPPTATPTSRASTIGGTTVPDDLDCEEDEGIAFRGVPDTLFCVHIEPER
jgi:hypothetical protein